MSDIAGKVAFITGAAHPRGIGRAIYNALANAGATVVASDIDGADGLVDIAGLPCDVTDQASVDAAISTVIQQHQRLDIVVNNAGVGVGNADFLATKEADWNLSLAVNVQGVANVCRASLPHMLDSGGSIINVASLAGIGALNAIPACYTASKFAVVGLTKALALQYAGSGVRVNAICPGSIKTQLHAQSLALIAEERGISIEEAQGVEDAAIPLGYSADADDVGAAALFLAGNSARYITGTTMPVAGGMAPGL